MLKLIKNKIHIYIFYIFLIVSFIVILVEYVHTKGYFKENRFSDYNLISFSDGWKDEQGKEITLPCKENIKKEQDFIVKKTIDKQIKEDSYMLFYADHTYVKAYINDKKVYQFGNRKEIPFGKTPGSGWQLIPIVNTSVGDEIKLVINCPYDHYSGILKEIRIGSKNQLNSYIFKSGLWRLVLVVIPLFIGVGLLVIPLLFLKQFKYRNFFNMGMSFVILSVWSFTEARTWQLFFNNNYVMQTINFVTFSLVTACLVLSLNAAGFLKDSKTYRRLLLMNEIVPIILFILQVTNIADYFETLFIVHIMMFVSMFISYYVYTKSIKSLEGESKQHSKIVLIVLLAIYACGLLDFYNFYILINRFANGEFIRFALVLFMISICIVGMKRAIVLNHEKIKEETLEKMAYTDELTGLYNRRAFHDKVKEIDEKKENVTIVYADMNGLKWINDNRGHYMGDEAIKLVASMINKHLPSSIGNYRIGGDEFSSLCVGNTVDEIEKICSEINNDLANHEEEFKHIISISYGVVGYESDSEKTVSECVVEADKIMYSRKQKLYLTT